MLNRSVSKMNDLKHEVIYKDGAYTITANITQKDLAALLMRSDVQLISVNAPKKPYYPRKRKK